MMTDNDIRDLAGRIVGQNGRFVDCGISEKYIVNYDGKTFTSDCTAKLADDLADYIREQDRKLAKAS